jgi:hypothetical protein
VGRRDVGCERMATPLGTNGLSFAFCLSIAIIFVMLCLFVYFSCIYCFSMHPCLYCHASC